MIRLKNEKRTYELVKVLSAPKLSIQQEFGAIMKVFENVSYMGELRQRWVEIKKLLKGGLQDIIPVAMCSRQTDL